MRAITARKQIQRETTMTIKSKIAAALAVVTLASGLATSSAQAKGWGIGAGIVGGAILGAAVVGSAGAHGYYADGYRRCRFERQYDAYGFYLGTVKVCRFY
jgi:hypothetical protein